MTERLTTTHWAVGQRVELHPATDWWMRGARFGEVVIVGRTWTTVKLDKGPRVRLHAHNIWKAA